MIPGRNLNRRHKKARTVQPVLKRKIGDGAFNVSNVLEPTSLGFHIRMELGMHCLVMVFLPCGSDENFKVSL
jgi:hypothetical protein